MHSRQSEAVSEVDGQVGDAVVDLLQRRLAVRDAVAEQRQVLDQVAFARQEVAREREQHVLALLQGQGECQTINDVL